ncbi:hypothetical protein TNIN_483961 [Trichonephila inaurata madagascariensis]|uniref:Uncharacterized protein n=1 Tax=Trichonephila inaurata madagascariensis TaxID=2747483 RepID=A0A8X7CJK1_9ARAC|nr:hypothetical protein TNIN_483961 [Trichonephila inaurata madagascariensis]
MQFPDSKSDDDSDFPEISLTELLEDMKKKNTQQNTQKETATESRIIPNSKFQYDDTTLFDKESQGLSHNRIQPSKILPREPPKRKFIDAVHSSKSKRVRLDIPPNAKRKHKDDSKSNCEKPIKKTRCDSPQIKEFENNPATYDQSELHDPFQNNSFDKTKEKSETLLKIELPEVSLRMELQENADCVESDMSEGLNNDGFSKDN